MIFRRQNNDNVNEMPSDDESPVNEDSVTPPSPEGMVPNPDHDPNDPESLEFVPINPAVLSAGASAVNFVRTGGIGRTYSAVRAIKEGRIGDALYDVGITEDAELANNLNTAAGDVGKVINILKPEPGAKPQKISTPKMTMKGTIPPSGGNRRERHDDGNDSGYYDAIRMSLVAHPTEVRLNTGIVAKLISPEDHIAEAGWVCPLHCNTVRFEFPETTSTFTGSYIQTGVMYDLQNAIQRNLNYSADIASVITINNLIDWFNDTAYALQQYYAVARLIVYMGDPNNKNSGILKLCESITPDVAYKFSQLKRTLNGIPIPPNLNILLFWLMQFYASSELSGSPIICFNPNVLTSGTPSWGELTSAINLLTNDTYKKVSMYIGKAIPNWYTTNPLTGIANPLHDPEFTTVWVNAPFTVNITSPATVSISGPAAASVDDPIKYNVYTELLDGGAFALTSTYSSSTGTFIPGLLVPYSNTVSGGTSSRLSYSSSGFVESCSTDVSAFGRDDTYTLSYRFGSAANTSLNLGAQKVWNVSPRFVTTSANKLADWCLSWTTVATIINKNLTGPAIKSSDIDQPSPSRNPSGNGSKRRGKSKRK